MKNPIENSMSGFDRPYDIEAKGKSIRSKNVARALKRSFTFQPDHLEPSNPVKADINNNDEDETETQEELLKQGYKHNYERSKNVNDDWKNASQEANEFI